MSSPGKASWCIRVFMSPGSTHHTLTAASSAASTRLHCSKAALEQLTAILAAEQPGLRVYSVDPGDMRTQMHQEAFPGEDISDRPPPEQSVPGLLELIDGGRPSGRYRAGELVKAAT